MRRQATNLYSEPRDWPMEPELQDILDVILNAVDELNRQLPEAARLARDRSALLIGKGGILDSLSLITLMVGIEERLQARLGLSLALLDEEMLAQPEGHYRSIDSLSNWILDKAR